MGTTVNLQYLVFVWLRPASEQPIRYLKPREEGYNCKFEENGKRWTWRTVNRDTFPIPIFIKKRQQIKHVFLKGSKLDKVKSFINIYMLLLLGGRRRLSNQTQFTKEEEEEKKSNRRRRRRLVIVSYWRNSFRFVSTKFFVCITMSSPMESSDFAATRRFSRKPSFSQTCSRLSQYLKENGSFGDLSLGMACKPEVNGKQRLFFSSRSFLSFTLIMDSRIE